MRDNAGIPVEQIRYVTGLGETCNGFVVAHGPRGPELRATNVDQGDCTVLWATGIPDKAPAWHAAARHGDLCRTRSLFPAIADLLPDGATTCLPREPGRRDCVRADAAIRTFADEPLPIIPINGSCGP